LLAEALAVEGQGRGSLGPILGSGGRPVDAQPLVPERIRFRGLDAEGNPVSGEAEGMTARVMQHETDHLNGVLYPMRMQDLSLLGFTEELARAAGSAGR
jgi:hypothetical protein